MRQAGIMIAFAALSYLLGAVPFGFLLARARGVDIRQTGSGNIGATNVFRAVGKTWGLLTFLCDCTKGFVPAFVFPILAGRLGCPSTDVLAVLCAFLAVVGHNWPIYLRFKGGKGVATSAGALLGIAPVAVAIGLATWIGLLVLTRYVSVASISAALAIAVTAWARRFVSPEGENLLVPCALTLLACLAIWRHKSNIQRLLAGTENRFDFRKKQRGTAAAGGGGGTTDEHG